ncbi:MAG: PilZ domain-containing protein [Planctomycetota bacterium]
MAHITHERRGHQRVQVPDLSSPYGEVIDLSLTGMKVYRKGGRQPVVGDRLEATLEHSLASVKVAAEVVWVEDVGLRRRLIGCRFLDPTEADQKSLGQLIGVGHDEVKGPAVYVERD